MDGERFAESDNVNGLQAAASEALGWHAAFGVKEDERYKESDVKSHSAEDAGLFGRAKHLILRGEKNVECSSYREPKEDER